MDPVNIVVAGLNTTIRLFEVTYQLKAADEQAADLLSTTQHVSRNIDEARRLRQTKARMLSIGEAKWIDKIIKDTEDALREIAYLIEPARVDQTTAKNISFKHKFLWVFRENPKVQNKHQRLSVCHQSLTAVINCLYGKNLILIRPGTSSVDATQQQSPPPYYPEMATLFEWRKRRKNTHSGSDMRDHPSSNQKQPDDPKIGLVEDPNACNPPRFSLPELERSNLDLSQIWEARSSAEESFHVKDATSDHETPTIHVDREAHDNGGMLSGGFKPSPDPMHGLQDIPLALRTKNLFLADFGSSDSSHALMSFAPTEPIPAEISPPEASTKKPHAPKPNLHQRRGQNWLAYHASREDWQSPQEQKDKDK